MLSKVRSHSYFINTQPSNPSYPLFVFLPGMDETGKELMYMQTKSLDTAFDVRCFVIPPDDLKGWDDMTQQVASLTQLELEKAPRSSVYLCGESFGGCLALKVLEKFPQLFTRVILINSASAFSRVPWLSLGSLLFPLTPKLFYNLSSFIALPFLAHLSKISSTAKEALLKSTRSAPQATANQRLTLMRQFDVDKQKLSQTTQPVLIIASKFDRLLPSVEEAQHLAKIFPNHQIKILPDSGHACLLEGDVNLYELLISENFIV